MVDGFIFGKIARQRFEQRLIEHDGDLIVRLDRRTGVRVSRDEWRALVRDNRRAVRRYNWYIWGAFLGQLPNLILFFWLGQFAPVKAVFDWLDATVPGVLTFCILVWLPFTALFLHSRAMTRVTRDMLDRLAGRPRVDVSGLADLRKLHTLEVIVLILFGPGVFIDIYGTIYPDAFEYTPWSGRHVGWESLIALAAMAWIIGMAIRGKLAAANLPPPAPLPDAPRRPATTRWRGRRQRTDARYSKISPA